MDDRIDPGRGGHMPRQPQRQGRIEHRPIGGQRPGVDRQLDPPIAGGDRDGRGVRAGASGGRDQRQGQPLAFGDVHAPDRIEVVARPEQISGELGDIHRTAAAEPDHRPHRRRLTGSNRGHQRRPGRIGLDRVEQHHRPAARFQCLAAIVGQAEQNDLLVGDEQAWPGWKLIGERNRLACSRHQPGTGMKSETLHCSGNASVD